MLSYQHVYHAGNDADCHKHALLAALLRGLQADKTPLCVIDTHAGRGLYDFAAGEAQKLAEHAHGIRTIWPHAWPREAMPYRNVVESLNRGQVEIRHYPGSPWLAAAMLRAQDACVLYELHPAENRALRQAMARLPGVAIHQADGWHAAVPAAGFSRGLIVVDPSYELKHEYTGMAERLNDWAVRAADYSIALWYPILRDARHKAMLDALQALDMPSHRSELRFRDSERGMVGTGFFVLRPPAGFAAKADAITAWLSTLL